MQKIIHRVNSIEQLKKTPNKFGVEIDLRSNQRELILSHDPSDSGENFKDFLKDAGVKHRGPNQLRHTGASIHFNSGVSVAWIAELLGHRDVSIVEKHYAKRNKVSLKKEQAKANKTVAELFNTADESSITVPSDIVEAKHTAQPIANEDDKAFIQNLLQLARAAKSDEHREQIYTIIDQTLQGGL